MKKQFRLLNRDGSTNIVRKDHGKIQRDDLYFSLLTLTWPRFIFSFAGFFVVINILFGIAYFFIGTENFEGMRSGTPMARLLDSFFFSVQSFATIGYGKISPVSFLANLMVTIEAFCGILFTALATGIVFGRFSKPRSKLLFSDKVLITKIDGEDVIVVRVANERLNQIFEARIEMFVVQNEVSLEGERYRDFRVLKLEKNHSPIFALSWTIVHPIDQDSPFKGATYDSIRAKDTELFINLTGVDETLSQNIYARTSYIADDFIWNHRFDDMISRNDDGKLQIDLDKIHRVIPI